MRVIMIVIVLAATSVAADTEIHRCLLEDGTLAFQEMPCPEPAANADDGAEAGEVQKDREAPAVNTDDFDYVNPFDEPEGPPTLSETTLPEPVSLDRAECQKTTRDAIDTIDLEMREKAYTSEQGQEYLAELLELTKQLRACKQL